MSSVVYCIEMRGSIFIGYIIHSTCHTPCVYFLEIRDGKKTPKWYRRHYDQTFICDAVAAEVIVDVQQQHTSPGNNNFISQPI